MNAFLRKFDPAFPVLFLSLSILMVGQGLQSSLLGMAASAHGFAETITGIVMAGYFVGFIFGSVLVPRLVGNVGHIRVFAALASLASICVVLHTIIPNPIIWFLIRVVSGISFSGLYVVIESWLNEVSSNETRGTALSLYMITQFAGMALGQTFLTVDEPTGFLLFVISSIFISLALVPVSLTKISAPAFDSAEALKFRDLVRISPSGVFTCMAAGIASSSLYTMGAVAGTEMGMAPSQIANFMSALLFGGLILQWPVGRISDRTDRRYVIAGVCIISASILMVMAMWSFERMWVFLLLTLTIGGFVSTIASLGVAHTNDYVAAGQRVAASAGLMMVYGLGAICGPLISGVSIQLFGGKGLFGFTAIVCITVGLLTMMRMNVRLRRPRLSQRYVAFPRGTPQILESVRWRRNKRNSAPLESEDEIT